MILLIIGYFYKILSSLYEVSFSEINIDMQVVLQSVAEKRKHSIEIHKQVVEIDEEDILVETVKPDMTYFSVR